MSRKSVLQLEDMDDALYLTVTSDLPVEAEVELKGESPLRVQTAFKKNTFTDPRVYKNNIKFLSSMFRRRNIDINPFLQGSSYHLTAHITVGHFLPLSRLYGNNREDMTTTEETFDNEAVTRALIPKLSAV